MALRRLDRDESHRFDGDAFDVRGWKVRTRPDDAGVGTVDGMLLDADGEFRYLDVDLGLMRKHVLLPLDFATAERENDVVWVEGLTKAEFERMPEAVDSPELLTDEYERRLRQEYRAANEGPTRDDNVLAEDGVASRDVTRLSDMDDYRVRGSTDPRGWTFVTGDGRKLGKVEELLVDLRSLRARYLLTDVDEKALELERIDRHILVPVQHLELDDSNKRVIAGGLFASDLDRYPVYRGLPLRNDAVDEIDRFWDDLGSRDGDDSRGKSTTGRALHETQGETARTSEGAARPRDGAADRFFGRARGSKSLREGESVTVRGGHEVRISLRGDDIVVERED